MFNRNKPYFLLLFFVFFQDDAMAINILKPFLLGLQLFGKTQQTTQHLNDVGRILKPSERCPRTSEEWRHMSKKFCPNQFYQCLPYYYNEKPGSFVEGCRMSIKSAPRGWWLAYSENYNNFQNIHIEPCDEYTRTNKELYQPFCMETNEVSGCQYVNSQCSSLGQKKVINSYKSHIESACQCDEKNGYFFIEDNQQVEAQNKQCRESEEIIQHTLSSSVTEPSNRGKNIVNDCDCYFKPNTNNTLSTPPPLPSETYQITDQLAITSDKESCYFIVKDDKSNTKTKTLCQASKSITKESNKNKVNNKDQNHDRYNFREHTQSPYDDSISFEYEMLFDKEDIVSMHGYAKMIILGGVSITVLIISSVLICPDSLDELTDRLCGRQNCIYCDQCNGKEAIICIATNDDHTKISTCKCDAQNKHTCQVHQILEQDIEVNSYLELELTMEQPEIMLSILNTFDKLLNLFINGINKTILINPWKKQMKKASNTPPNDTQIDDTENAVQEDLQRTFSDIQFI